MTDRIEILIAEDSPTQARQLQYTLEQQGYSVTHAANGRLALDAARARRPSLVISDVVMPEMDGYELCLGLKADPNLADVPVILVTTLSDPSDVIRGLECRADSFILKPYDERYLLSRVQFVLMNHAMRRSEQSGMAIEVFFNGNKHVITADRLQILNLLLSTYDAAIQRNKELIGVKEQLERRTEELAGQAALLSAATREAERANRAKSDFLSRMSHDLRTPLNAILGFAQLLGIEPLPPDQAESVRHILKGGAHLLDLINGVLDIARIEAGHLSLSPEPVVIGDVLAQVVPLVQPLAAQRRLILEDRSGPFAHRHVMADRQRLQQILLNLLSNAVKYNREHGRILVACDEASPGRIRIKVTDTGAGIPPRKLPLLFQPFERLGADQSMVEGTGLGLASAKALAEAMNGRMGVESEVDRGSTFWVELPETTLAAPAEQPALREGTLPENLEIAGTVLYVEDNAQNHLLVDRVVRRRPGVRMLSAYTGEEGCTIALRERPDLILLDLHLPDMHGEHVLQRLWEDAQTRAIPVAVLTADATQSQQRRLLAAGAKAYLVKPLNIADVLSLIDEVLGARK